MVDGLDLVGCGDDERETPTWLSRLSKGDPWWSFGLSRWLLCEALLGIMAVTWHCRSGDDESKFAVEDSL